MLTAAQKDNCVYANAERFFRLFFIPKDAPGLGWGVSHSLFWSDDSEMRCCQKIMKF